MHSKNYEPKKSKCLHSVREYMEILACTFLQCVVPLPALSLLLNHYLSNHTRCPEVIPSLGEQNVWQLKIIPNWKGTSQFFISLLTTQILVGTWVSVAIRGHNCLNILKLKRKMTLGILFLFTTWGADNKDMFFVL